MSFYIICGLAFAALGWLSVIAYRLAQKWTEALESIAARMRYANELREQHLRSAPVAIVPLPKPKPKIAAQFWRGNQPYVPPTLIVGEMDSRNVVVFRFHVDGELSFLAYPDSDVEVVSITNGATPMLQGGPVSLSKLIYLGRFEVKVHDWLRIELQEENRS